MKLIEKKMKQRFFFGAAAIACGMFLLVSSCVKDELDFNKFGGVNYNGDFAVPLVHSELSFKNLLSAVDSSNLLVDDSTQGLSIVYTSTVFSQTADQIFIIPDQDYTSPNVNYPMLPIANGDSSMAVPIDMSFEFDSLNNGEQIDKVVVKSGKYKIELNSDIDHNGRITVELTSVWKNGKPLKFDLDYTYNSLISRGTVSKLIDLAGCEIVLNNEGGKRNEFGVTASVVVYGDDHSSVGGANYYLRFNHELSNIKYDKLFGYLGQRVFNMALGSVDINIFKNNIMGGVTLDDPRLILKSTNSFGIPLEVRVDTFKAVSKIGGEYDIVSSQWPYSIKAPSSSSPLVPVVSFMNLNNTTTNNTLSNAVKTSPQKVIYKISSKTNPSGVAKNFVYSNSRFDVDVTVDLPLAGTMSGYVMQDTLPYTMQNLDQIDYMEFRTIVENTFPVDAAFQIYFLNDKYEKLDSLFTKDQAVISGGIPDPTKNNKVTQARRLMTDTKLSSSMLKKSVDSKYILIKSTMSTTKVNGESLKVKFYSEYKMDVKLSTRVQLKAKM